MNYTTEEKELIVKWRPYYEKLISDAIQRVVQKEKELIPSYIPEEPEELNIVEKAAKKIDTAITKEDGETWDRSYHDLQYNDPVRIYSLMNKAMKEHPEEAGSLKGISLLYIALDIMKRTGENCSDRWLLNVLEDFYKIYEQDPTITDTEAMIRFMQKEEVIKSAGELGTIPHEIRESLDLNLDDNLKPFLEQYKDCLAMRVSRGPGVSDSPFRDSAGSQKENQSSTDNQFKERVKKDDDGVYRWTYDRRGSDHKPKEVFWMTFKTDLAAVLTAYLTLFFISALMMRIVFKEYRLLNDPFLFIGAILLWVVISAVLSGLFALFKYRSCLREYYTYEMTEKSIRLVPGSRESKMWLQFIKRMEIFPEYDLILLGGNIIYVPSEDFLMVQEFLSSRLHKKAKIRMHGV